MKKLSIASALLLALTAAPAFAADMPLSGKGYIRAEGGNSTLTIDGEDGDDNVFAIRGGYRFHPNLAVEGFYANVGEQSEDGASAKLDGFGIGLSAKKNFRTDNTGFFIGGRAGMFRGKGKLSVDGLGSVSDTATKPYFGVGAGYDFTPQFGVSLNYDMYQLDLLESDMDAKTLSLGLELRF